MQKVGLDNHNPVKTSNKQAKGELLRFFVCVTAEAKN